MAALRLGAERSALSNAALNKVLRPSSSMVRVNAVKQLMWRPQRLARRGVCRAQAQDDEPVGFGRRVLQGDGMDGIKLECDESGCVVVLPPQVQDDMGAAGTLRCDMTGCTVSDGPPPEPKFEEVEGQGWRIGYETRPESEDSFCAMVGAGGWSVGLTAKEFTNFVDLLQMLRSSLVTMDEDGMVGGDEVQLEVEKGSIWMQCSLPKKRVSLLRKFWDTDNGSELSAFEIRFILGGPSNLRQAEGFWPAEAVMDFLRKLDEHREVAGRNGAAHAPAFAEEVTVAAV